MSAFPIRLLGAILLQPELYEEVEADRTAGRQAFAVVVLASIAAGIGTGSATPTSLLIGSLGALFAWFVWALLTYLIGTKLLPGEHTRSDLGELLRTIGFASTPGLFRVFGVAGGAPGDAIVLVADLWMLAAMVVAVRQALDYTSTWRAVVVCLSGWWVLVLFSILQRVVANR